MRRILIIIGVSLVLTLGVPATALYWLCCTESGLHWLVGQTSRLKSMTLRFEDLHGTLNGPITAKSFYLSHERIEMTATNVRAQLKLHSLLLQTIHVGEVKVDSVVATLKPRTSPPSTRKPRFLPVAWLTVRTDNVTVANTRLTLLNGSELSTVGFLGDMSVSSSDIEFDNLHVENFIFATAKDADAPQDSEAQNAAMRIALEGSAQLHATDPTGLDGEMGWTVEIPQQPSYSGRTRFKGDLAQLNFDGDVLQPLQAKINGKALDLTSGWHWEAQTLAPAFNLKPWSPESGLGNFIVNFNGKGDSAGIHLSGRIEPQSLPTGPVDVAIDGAYAARTFRTDKLHLQLINGTQLTTAGEIRFLGGPPTLDLKGNWSKFSWPLKNPVVKSVRGQLSLSGAIPYAYVAQGDVFGPQIPVLQFTASGAVGRERLVVRELVATTHDGGTINASGAMPWDAEQPWRLAVDARELNPSLAHADYPGHVSFRLEGSGRGFKPEGPWEAQLIGLRGEVRKQSVSGHANVSLNAKVWNIESALLQFGSTRFEANGRFDERPGQQPDIRWLFSSDDLSQLITDAGGTLHFSGRMGGTYEAPKLTASLNAADLKYKLYSAKTLQAQADLDMTAALSASLVPQDAGDVHLQLEGTDIKLIGQRFSSAKIDLDGNTADHKLQVEAVAPNGKLEVAVQGAYTTPRQWQGKLEKLSINASQTKLALDKPAGLFVGETRIEIEPFCLKYDPQRICGHAKAEGAAGSSWQQFALEGALQAETSELGFIPALVPEIDRASGKLNANLRLSGTLGAPQIEGTLGLEKGELDMYTVNLLMREVSMHLEMAGKTLSLDGAARAGDGRVAIDGKLAWESGAPFGTLNLKGENLLIVNVPEAQVKASPNINVTLNGREIQVEGAVRVPYARLSPANLSGAMLPSEDEVIVGRAATDPDKSFKVTTGIHMILGEDVRVDTYGLSGRITGGIAAYTAPEEASTGTGELEIKDGKYVAYGRELEIERGRLIFTGGVLSNPGVDIRATKKIQETLAGINVRGTLRDPRVSFFSEPPLPQTQAASLLITGRTFDSLQEGGGPGLGREQLLAQGGALLAKQLGGQLGIDDVSVESGAGANADTSLVLGKYLSPRLYVGYGISLAESINTLKLRYTLGDRWTIKMEAGENRSADVVYAIDR